jgi:hypothetical protein
MTQVAANSRIRAPACGVHLILQFRTSAEQEDDGRMADEMSVGQKFDLLLEHFGEIARKVDAMDRRFDTIDRRFDAMDQRFDAMDRRFDAMDQRFDAMDQKFSVEFDAVRADIRLVAEGVDAGNERLDRVAAEARDHHNKQYVVLDSVARHLRVRVDRLEGGRRPT